MGSRVQSSASAMNSARSVSLSPIAVGISLPRGDYCCGKVNFAIFRSWPRLKLYEERRYPNKAEKYNFLGAFRPENSHFADRL